MIIAIDAELSNTIHEENVLENQRKKKTSCFEK